MTESVTGKNKTRYYLVDALRGLALINMVLYHFSYDIFVCSRPMWATWNIPYHVFCMNFVCICGGGVNLFFIKFCFTCTTNDTAWH